MLPENDEAEPYVHLVQWCAQHYNLYDAWIQIRVWNSKRSKFVSLVHDLGNQEYCIDINPAAAKDQKSSVDVCIIHEMTHVKQYYHSELIALSGTWNIWHGQKYYMDDTTTGYYRYPWEIEARAAEDELGFLYSNQLKAEGQKIRIRRKSR